MSVLALAEGGEDDGMINITWLEFLIPQQMYIARSTVCGLAQRYLQRRRGVRCSWFSPSPAIIKPLVRKLVRPATVMLSARRHTVAQYFSYLA